jgi:hypothetical protein
MGGMRRDEVQEKAWWDLCSGLKGGKVDSEIRVVARKSS